MSTIVAEKLAGGYGDRVIWKDADFSIEPGEFVAVIGPNGAGKTTLFRMFLGLASPTGGTLSIFGEPPRRGSSRIGYVPQQHPIDDEIRVEALELVRLGLDGNRFGIGSSEEGAAAALAALRAVDAEALAHRPLGKLSGGELQRIFLAEALIGNPDLLLLDEPLANLDLRRETDLVRLVHDVVHARRVTALLVAHNINPLLPFIDRVLYVANGRVISGRPEEVLTSRALSEIYGVPIEVLKDARGRIAIVGMDEAVGHKKHVAQPL